MKKTANNTVMPKEKTPGWLILSYIIVVLFFSALGYIFYKDQEIELRLAKEYFPAIEPTIIVTIILAIISTIVYIAYLWKKNQKKYYKALLKAELDRKALIKHYEYLVKYANDIILLADQGLKITECNDKALEEYGYSYDEIINLSLLDIIDPKDHDDFLLKINQLKTLGSYVREGVHRRKNNTTFLAETSGRLIIIEGKTYFQGITRNISDRKLAQDNLKQANEQLAEKYADLKHAKEELIRAKEKAEEADRLKTAFLQNMSHEIRTPMNAIVGFANLLENNISDINKIREFCNIITQRSNDLLAIINEILEISEIETGQVKVTPEEVNINSMLDDLLSFFNGVRKQLGKDSIEIICYKLPLPQVILTDNVKLKQIFINLLHNAVKYTSSGKIKFGFKSRNDSKITFFVSDTGSGIPPDKHSIIFERFRQIDSDNATTREGLGLGLSIVKGLIDLLHGNIWLESALGEGTVFYFDLPYQKNIIEHDMEKPGFTHQKIKYNWDKRTILIVEDEPSNRDFLKELLKISGVRLFVAQTGKEAIEISRKIKDLDLILMDIRLPDMSGNEVTRRIKQYNPSIPIIAQTAYAMDSDKEKSLEAGCDNFITKPIELENLFGILAEYLGKN